MNVYTKVEEALPEVFVVDESYSKSKLVVVLCEGEPLVAVYSTGLEGGEFWDNWCCPAYEFEVLEGVTAWCDCLPEDA